MNKSLTIEEVTKIPVNQLLAMYDQGYRLTSAQRGYILPLDMTTGIVGYWKFDGNASDSSGNNNNGTLVGTTLPTFVTGKIGQAVHLDGTNQEVTVPSSPTLDVLNNVTFAGWVKFTPATGKKRLIAKSNSTVDANNSIQIALDSTIGQVNVYWRNNSATVINYQSTPGVTSNVLTHVAVSLSSGIVKIYIGGALVAQTTGGITTAFNADTNLHIGAAGGFNITADIDELRKYNRVLTDADVAELAAYTGGPPPAGCPTSIEQGTTHNIAVNASGGVPGYVYKLYAGTILVSTYPTTGTTPDISHTFSYNFPEAVGSRTYRTDVVDSCSPTPQTVSNSCSINITAPPCPTFGVNMTIT